MVPPVPNVPLDEEHAFLWKEYLENLRQYILSLEARIHALEP